MKTTPHLPATTSPTDFFHAVVHLTADLYGRWLDEKDYEDINDYQAPIQRVADDFGITVLKMTKRPFGFHFRTDVGTYALTVNMTSASFKRIA